jgi:hypothetical protein
MMNIKSTVIFILLIAASLSVFAQGKKSDKRLYGVNYTLPKTYLSIVIKAKKTVYKPGEFSQYAERYLKLSDVATEPSTRWEFVSAKINLLAKPDTSKVFFVEMNEKTVAPLMDLTSDGIVKSINMTASSSDASSQPDVTSGEVQIGSNKEVDPHSFLTEDILMAGSTAKMAELVSKEIYNIRESRSELVRGQADNLPKDGAQLKLMLDNLDVQEKAMTSLFTGSNQYFEKTVVVPVDIREVDNDVAFRFSSAFGVVDKDDLSGRPFYLTIKQIKKEESQSLPEKKEKDEDKGIAYNLPGRALVSLKDGNKKVIESEYPATQFGTVSYLAPVLFNKKSTIKVQFDPVTGGLIKVDRGEE